MALDIIGSQAAIQQGSRKTWDFNTGEREIRSWKGVNTAIANLYALYKAVAGNMPELDSLDLDMGRGIGTLVASLTEDASQAVYELFANDIYKPIEQHKYFAISGTPLTATQIVNVRRAISLGKTEAEVSAAPWSFATKQLELWQLYAKGTVECVVRQYVLRETYIVSKRSQLTASYTGVETVQDPPNAKAVNQILGNIPTQEWLKRTPVVRTLGKIRWSIMQEWWGADAWSAVMYGGTATP